MVPAPTREHSLHPPHPQNLRPRPPVAPRIAVHQVTHVVSPETHHRTILAGQNEGHDMLPRLRVLDVAHRRHHGGPERLVLRWRHDSTLITALQVHPKVILGEEHLAARPVDGLPVIGKREPRRPAEGIYERHRLDVRGHAVVGHRREDRLAVVELLQERPQ